MMENVLAAKHWTFRMKLTVKFLIAAGIVVLAVALPQLAHLAFGAQAGMQLLPMYLPVLLGGCLLGTRWGLGVGLCAPFASYLFTTAVTGTSMPAAGRLPFMMAELVVFAVVAGCFAKQIMRHAWMAFPAVWTAQLTGRVFFLLSVMAFQKFTPFTPSMIVAQIKIGLPGLALQALVVPFLVIACRTLFLRDTRHD